jgi:hypothetical protein
MGRLPWPLPALAAWAASWMVFLVALKGLEWPPLVSVLPAAALAVAASVAGATRWQRLFIAWGFPLSLVASGLLGDVPAWVWLLPLAALAIVYPLRTWRDAPLFPTPAGALQGLAARVPLAAGDRILDVGCGLGDALAELHREYPQARIEGIEWSRPLRIVSAVRCRYAAVRRADMWAADWSACRMVYVFQRPETMHRLGRKAAQELARDAWLVSLESPVPGWVPTVTLQGRGGRQVWLYRMT